MGVAMLAVPLATRSYRHRSLPLPRSRPMAASAVKTTTLREPPASYTIGDEYAAQPLCDFHSSLTLILSRATTAAPGPPGVTTTRPPSTSGDSLIPQCGPRPRKRSTMVEPQIVLPVAVSRHTSMPSAARAYRRSPSTVGVPRGPCPRDSLNGIPVWACHNCLPVLEST